MAGIAPGRCGAAGGRVADGVSPKGACLAGDTTDDANKNVKKFYAANAKGGVTKIHPKMLELWHLHTRSPWSRRPRRGCGSARARASWGGSGWGSMGLHPPLLF
mmetsp:Transcript_33969/g.80444  ORF Transcript_33969/g.80444 Transcript_33969/m.80444 type:complete len:104 (-) Transcript_33969:83-394(-)